MRITIVAALTLVLGVVGVPTAAYADGPAAPDAIDYCDPTFQAANTCLGFFTTDASQDPITAAIAAALAAGNVSGAYEFYQGVSEYLDGNETALIDAAFDAEAQSAGEGAEVIYGATGADTSLAGQAAQTKHGNCCATSSTTWTWNAHEVNYGYCEETPGGVTCESLGHFYAQVDSNVTFFPEVYWYHGFSYKSGHQAFLNNLTVKMRRDVLHKADPRVVDYPMCGSGWLPNRCEGNENSPTTAGNFYYVALNADVSCACGRPSVHLEVQTRRWYVPSYGYPTYPAYYNGG